MKLRVTRAAVAAAIQVSGLIIMSFAVAVIAAWGGILTFGVGLIVFGIAVERG